MFLRKIKEKRGQVSFVTQLRVMSEQWRQDVDLTVSIVTPDGEVHCLESKDNLTVGKDRAISNVTWVTMASRTKMPEFPCAMASSDFVAMFADGQAPTLRIVLAPELDAPGDAEAARQEAPNPGRGAAEAAQAENRRGALLPGRSHQRG